MQYERLGRTGLKVSRLCLGTMNFGPETSEKESHAVMDKAMALGINFFDTANVYGWKRGEGWTEQIIGRWLAQGGRRDQIVLATKVYGRTGEGENERRLSAYHIRRACEESLRRLQTDHIDLYQMHHIDSDTPWEEIWQAMEILVRQGKVIYVGSSNFPAWQIATANQLATQRSFMGLVSEQSIYSLQTRMIELEVIPACRAYGLGFLPYSPLAGGLLAGALAKATEGRRSTEEFQAEVEKVRSPLTQYEDLCKRIGEAPATVALAWVLSNPAVTSPIIGPRTLEQLTGSLRALEITLDEQILRQLDKIWPGPRGEAPEAYAW